VEQLILSKILEFPGLDVKIAILIYVKNVWIIINVQKIMSWIILQSKCPSTSLEIFRQNSR
jgi:hypothetical protein